MPTFGHRITVASDRYVRATRRLAAAEQQIMQTLLDQIDNEDTPEPPNRAHPRNPSQPPPLPPPVR